MTARCTLYLVALKTVGSPWLRPWDKIRGTPKIGQSLDTPMLPFHQNFSGILFEWSNLMYWPNLKSVTLTGPKLIGGIEQKLGSPCIRPRSLFFIILNGLLLGWTLWMYVQNLKFVALPVPDIVGPRRLPPKLGTPWIRPRSLFSKIFNGLLFGWTLCMYWPNLKSVAFPLPEITGGTWKNWAVRVYAHAPFCPKIFMGFCSGGPYYCSGQIRN